MALAGEAEAEPPNKDPNVRAGGGRVAWTLVARGLSHWGQKDPRSFAILAFPAATLEERPPPPPIKLKEAEAGKILV